MPEERDDLSAADEALRVLRADLSVAPSPDFAARVRARVAAPPEPGRRWRWLVPAAAAAVLLIGAVVWMRLAGRLPAPIVAVELPAPPTTIAKAAPAPTPSPEPVRAARRVAAPDTAAPRAIVRVRAIVPPGEEMRIARYVASVRRWPHEADTLPESDPWKPLAEPAPIAIAPISVAPLVPDEGSPR